MKCTRRSISFILQLGTTILIHLKKKKKKAKLEANLDHS